MKRIWTALLSLAVLMSALCFLASAQQLEVTDQESFTRALEAGGTVVLKADIPLTTYVDIFEDITIDLNGHRIVVAEGSSSTSIMNRYDKTVVIRDSVGTGRIGSEEKRVSVSSEGGTLIIEGGSFARVRVNGGHAEIKGGTIEELQFDSIHDDVTVFKHEAAQVKAWQCQRGTVNIDPTAYLIPGFAAAKNPDGTYTVDTVTVEKTGQTNTFYYEAYSTKRGDFLHTFDGTAPQQLHVEVLYVNDGESEIITMTKCDEEGKLWSAEIDKAYVGAQMQVVNYDAGISTVLLTVSDIDGAKYTADGQWDQIPEPGSPWWIWVIAGAGAAAVAAVVVIILIKKKKK